MNKKIFGGVLALVMAISPIGAMAADINITIDGEKFIPKDAAGNEVEPFIDNGSTYLSVRAIGGAAGKTIEFDPENYAVYVGERPSDDDVEDKVLRKVNDRLFYESDKLFFSLTDDECRMIDAVASEAERLFTDETIREYAEKYINESIGQDVVSAIAQQGINIDAIERGAYYFACESLLQDSEEVTDGEIDEYVTVKHILTESADKAKEVTDKLADGVNFSDLIEEYNQDPGQSRDSSYTFTKGQMVKEFEDASYALKEGEYTKEAVQSDYGYHIIIKLPLDKETATNAVKSIKYEALVIRLQEKAKNLKVTRIDIPGEYIGEIDGRKVRKETVRIFAGDEADYEAAFDSFVEITGLYHYFVENNIFTPLETDAMAIADDTPEAAAEAYMNFISAVQEKIDDGKISMNDVEIALAEEAANVNALLYRNVRVFVDGKEIIPTDVNGDFAAPKNEDGTVYVPLRAIVEALGMKADWDNDTRTVLIERQ